MLHQLETGIASFPELFVANSDRDIAVAKENGLPYVVWKSSDERLIKAVLYHLVCKMLPGVPWDKLWGLTPRERGYGQDGYVYALDGNTENDTMWEESYSVDDYLVGSEVHVDVEELEALGLLPKFLGDMYDCIKINITDAMWKDGINKKTGQWTGNVLYRETLPNLIILDVSGSIPSGISTVMLALIDTIRHKCEAELIVTATKTYYWGKEDELPDRQKLARMCGWNNETTMFYDILKDHIAGRHFGHVFVFGDNDSPLTDWTNSHEENLAKELRVLPSGALCGTHIDCVHNFHTREERTCGYAMWCKEFADREEFDTSWVQWVDC